MRSMITTSQLKCTESIINDFKYAKEFKTPWVLFTQTHEVIGLGEFMSFLSNIIVETKSFAKLFKAIPKQELNSRIFYNGRNPMQLNTTKDLQIMLGIAPEQVTFSIQKLFNDINDNFVIVWEKDLTQNRFLIDLNKLKTEEGAINFNIHTTNNGDWLIPMTKKMLPVLKSDIILAQLLIHKSNPYNLYAYTRFVVQTKSGFIFETYFKILKV